MSEDLDPVIHAPARLRIMTTLNSLEEGEFLTFPRLQKLLDMTPGNLSTHLRKLDESGFVEIQKKITLAKPVTSVTMTRHGRDSFAEYLKALRAMLG